MSTKRCLIDWGFKSHWSKNKLNQSQSHHQEIINFDVGVFPRHGKRAIRDGETAYIIDESSLQDFGSSKAVDIEQDQEYL